jgi:hypothetical protein
VKGINIILYYNIENKLIRQLFDTLKQTFLNYQKKMMKIRAYCVLYLERNKKSSSNCNKTYFQTMKDYVESMKKRQESINLSRLKR